MRLAAFSLMELGFYSFNSLFEMPLGAELFPIGDPREPFNSLFEMPNTSTAPR
mgnify:CR=1 FL=1